MTLFECLGWALFWVYAFLVIWRFRSRLLFAVLSVTNLSFISRWYLWRVRGHIRRRAIDQLLSDARRIGGAAKQ